MTGQTGDRVVVEPKGVTRAARGGVIEEVLQQEPPRYRVRWDDGRESIIAPASGSVRIETAKVKATRKKTGARTR
jgi:head-tail adaptor